MVSRDGLVFSENAEVERGRGNTLISLRDGFVLFLRVCRRARRFENEIPCKGWYRIVVGDEGAVLDMCSSAIASS
jgi:hypothetical protein